MNDQVTTIENINDLANFKDGIYRIPYANRLKNQQFNKEKELLKFVVSNIKSFCRDVLNDQLISYEVEKILVKNIRNVGIRVDLYIEGANKVYLIEFKNPKYKSENRNAIGQILNYGIRFIDSKKEMIIITTKYDYDTARIIEHYNLPIRYIYYTKQQFLEFVRTEKI